MSGKIVNPDELKAQKLDQLNQVQQESSATQEFKDSRYATVLVDLPSKGLLYPDGHPLSKGVIEMKYMTAKEEDILTTESYIKRGVVLDKLFQSLIVTKFNYDDLLIGDRDAVMIAARVNGYGPKYDAIVKSPSGTDQKISVDLDKLPHKEIDEALITPGLNSFSFKLPVSQDDIVFKLLTVGDDRIIDNLLNKKKRANQPEANWTTRLTQMIQSVNGNEDRTYINLYVQDMRVADTRAFKQHLLNIQPGIDREVELYDEVTEEPFRDDFTIGFDFFWPDARL